MSESNDWNLIDKLIDNLETKIDELPGQSGWYATQVYFHISNSQNVFIYCSWEDDRWIYYPKHFLARCTMDTLIDTLRKLLTAPLTIERTPDEEETKKRGEYIAELEAQLGIIQARI